MRVVEDLGKLEANYVVITGDGRTELKVLRGLSQKFNGHNLILFFPFSSLPRRSGLTALDSVRRYPSKYGYHSIIYIVDGDTFEDSDPIVKVPNYLNSRGIEILEVNPIQDAFIINCRFGNHEVVLYSIISGPLTFIEVEIAKLFELTLGVEIDLTGERDIQWKKRVKREVIQTLRENKIKLEQLIRSTRIENLEISFPNICAVLKKIEEDFIRNNP